MAAYPTYTIGISSKQGLEDGWKDTTSSSGTLHSVQLHGKQYYHFKLMHPGLTGTQFETLLATYAAGPKDIYTLTYRVESPQITYSVKFTGPPQIVKNHGNNRYDVEVQLRGFKD